MSTTDATLPAGFYSTKSDFDRYGFAGPFPLDDRRLAARLMGQFPHFADRLYGRHRDVAAIREVLNDTNLRRKLTELCSGNLVLWRTNFFIKMPGSDEIGWHHDKHFQSAESGQIDFNEIRSHFSVCLALGDMNEKNGSLEVIPGSHLELPGFQRDTRPYYSRPIDDHFVDTIPDVYLQQRRSVSIQSGEFLVFHSALMHRSLPYESGPPRVSFVSRFVDNSVSIPESMKSKLSLLRFQP